MATDMFMIYQINDAEKIGNTAAAVMRIRSNTAL